MIGNWLHQAKTKKARQQGGFTVTEQGQWNTSNGSQANGHPNINDGLKHEHREKTDR